MPPTRKFLQDQALPCSKDFSSGGGYISRALYYREGNISVIEGIKNLPFRPARIFYLYDIPAGEERGGHSHKEAHQFMVSASGSFEVTLDDGSDKKSFFLNRPFYGLYIPPGIWAHEHNFSAGVICLVLTSDK